MKEERERGKEEGKEEGGGERERQRECEIQRAAPERSSQNWDKNPGLLIL